jgi:L-fuconolactonase
MTVDAHVHIWDVTTRDHSWAGEADPRLGRTFAPAELAGLADAAGVDALVLVQVLNSQDESAEFLDLADRDAFGRPCSVVGWVDLEASDVAERIAELGEGPGGARLAGIRHLVQAEPAGYLDRPQVRRGLAAVRDAGLVYDLLVRAWQLPEAVRAMQAVEGLQVVLDHGAKPPFSEGDAALARWRDGIEALATNPRISCKISGLVSEAGEHWSAEQIRPASDHLLACFGPHRCLAGSDWPVSSAVATYDQVWALAESLLSSLTPDERAAVLDRNARRVYRLGGTA